MKRPKSSLYRTIVRRIINNKVCKDIFENVCDTFHFHELATYDEKEEFKWRMFHSRRDYCALMLMLHPTCFRECPEIFIIIHWMHLNCPGLVANTRINREGLTLDQLSEYAHEDNVIRVIERILEAKFLEEPGLFDKRSGIMMYVVRSLFNEFVYPSKGCYKENGQALVVNTHLPRDTEEVEYRYDMQDTSSEEEQKYIAMEHDSDIPLASSPSEDHRQHGMDDDESLDDHSRLSHLIDLLSEGEQSDEKDEDRVMYPGIDEIEEVNLAVPRGLKQPLDLGEIVDRRYQDNNPYNEDYYFELPPEEEEELYQYAGGVRDEPDDRSDDTGEYWRSQPRARKTPIYIAPPGATPSSSEDEFVSPRVLRARVVSNRRSARNLGRRKSDVNRVYTDIRGD